MNKGLEALKLLGEMPKALSIGCETTLKVFCAKEFNIIEKDLEVLEIIKKINKTDLLHFFAITIKDETEFNLIKEWLER